ncbi:lipopolysaccharide assembly protein LapA domain-containing protein [Wukongibacter baidiensis]|uniref:LapA family protein n=1 Tax=Wukongibacter baidiensis TaxID=1723361 RepID=UPI003D7F6282
MQILFIFSLVFAILVSVFAVMNSDPVTIKLLWKQYEFSQAIIILGSAAIGAIIVALLGMVNRVKSGFKIRELQNKIKGLEKELEEFKPVDSVEVEASTNDEAEESVNIIEKPIIPDEETPESGDEGQV